MSQSASINHSHPSPHSQQPSNRNNPTQKDVFICGECAKQYQSKSSFYTHCKQKHNGIYPQNSKHNNQIFINQPRPRGRPQNTNNDPNDLIEKQISQAENKLLIFLGTLPKYQKQILIVTVQDPLEQLKKAINILKNQTQYNQITHQFLQKLQKLNKTVIQNHFPKYFDPMNQQIHQNKIDSTKISSIYKYITNTKKQKSPNQLITQNQIYQIIIIWLTRIISQKLLANVIYIIYQIINQSTNITSNYLIKNHQIQQFTHALTNIRIALPNNTPNLTPALQQI